MNQRDRKEEILRRLEDLAAFAEESDDRNDVILATILYVTGGAYVAGMIENMAKAVYRFHDDAYKLIKTLKESLDSRN